MSLCFTVLYLFLFYYHDEQLLNRCIVQYHFTGDEHEVLVRPHGNSKRSESYIRTMPSTLKELTEVASEKDTKTSCLSSQRGGASQNIRRKIKSSSGSLDPLHSVMMMCKDTMKDFVRADTGAPDYMVFWL